MVPRDNSGGVTPFVRSEVPDSASVLLVAADDAPDAGIACQNVLTTASERAERNLAVEYGTANRPWLDDLRYEPVNLTRTRVHEGNSLPPRVEAFLAELDEEERGVVYVDSISAMASDVGVEGAAAALADTVRILAPTDVTGLFRVDPDAVTPVPFRRLVDYTATYVPAEQGWRIPKADS